MNITLKYSSKPVDTLQDLISQFPEGEFNSPARSTIPNLIYWSTPELRVKSLCRRLVTAHPNNCTLDFEYKVPVQKGHGGESHTDLMIYWDGFCVGIEAKYREPPYPKVKDWIADGSNKQNRLDVLNGWCSLIESVTKTPWNEELLENATYQMIHRLASVCSRSEPNKYVVYQIFNPHGEKLEYYKTELMKIRKVFGGSGLLNLCLLSAEINPTEKYLSILEKWESTRSACGQEVMSGIIKGDLFSLRNINLINVA